MVHRHMLLAIIPALCCLVSCATMSRRMPHETQFEDMGDFLTRNDPNACRTYHYNFEREVPRLYADEQRDSIFGVIEYIQSECGPASNLGVTRLLLLAEQGEFDDSLVGLSTVPQLLWHRTEQEYRSTWRQWDHLYGFGQPVDNTHDRFIEFQTELARQVADNEEANPSGRAIGLFYAGEYDSAFALIQADPMHGTALQHSYDDYVAFTKQRFPDRFNVAFLAGILIPQDDLAFLGNHPDLGLQIGGEGPRWRADVSVNYRFLSAKEEFTVEQGERLVSTDDFNSWLVAVDGGFKFLNNARQSSDVFVGIGYDVIHSARHEGHAENHEAISFSFGLRHRVFVNTRSGMYLGAQIRYTLVDYPNPNGTDLDGNTITVSLLSGWSLHETLWQFLKNLNYKGNWQQ